MKAKLLDFRQNRFNLKWRLKPNPKNISTEVVKKKNLSKMIKSNEMETLTVIRDGIENKEELRAKNMKVEKQKVREKNCRIF